MFSELLDELTSHKNGKCAAVRDNKKLKEKAKSVAKRMKNLNKDISSLKEDICFEEANVIDLKEKVTEYEQVIDAMQAQMDDENDHYDNVIAYMEHYYEDYVATLSPRYIKKHWVNNEKRGKLTILGITFVNACCANHLLNVFLCNFFDMQVHMQSGSRTLIN